MPAVDGTVAQNDTLRIVIAPDPLPVVMNPCMVSVALVSESVCDVSSKYPVVDAVILIEMLPLVDPLILDTAVDA